MRPARFVSTLAVALAATLPSPLTGQVRPRAVAPPSASETAGPTTWSGTADWRGPTGFSHTGAGVVTQNWSAEADWALTSMNWRERRDDAVWFEFVGRQLCADQDCGYRTLHTFKTEQGNLTSQKSVVTGDERYATALAVCTSSSGKIKGVRLWSARIRADRTLEPGSERDQFERTNCRNWHSPEECGPRQVIVGIRAHGTTDKGYTGLSIRCGRVG
jgi:hypothetical protein